MAGPHPDGTTRRPAIVVGGQRRRLVRRTGLPRSNTAPALDLDSAPAGSVTNVATKAAATCTNPSTEPTAQAVASRTSVSPASSGRAAPSPTPSTEIGATTAMEGKKKHTMFRHKSKNDTCFHSPQGLSVTSPLPHITSPKAIRFYGLDAATNNVGDPQRMHIQTDGVNDDPVARPVLLKQSSMPLLTKFKDVAIRQTKFREEGIEPDPPKSKRFWESGNTKTKRALDLLPSIGLKPKRLPELQPTAASLPSYRSEENTESAYRIIPEQHTRPDLPQRARRSAPNRRSRKKAPKFLDRMSPITETSHDELGNAYRNSEHNTELDVISEYEDDHKFPPRSASLMPRSYTESLLTSGIPYELNIDDLSPTDGAIQDEEETDDEIYELHSGTQIDLNRVKWQNTTAISMRSPLQTVEDRLLDVTREDLDRHEERLNKIDKAKLNVDMTVANLKVSHEKLKKEFEAAQQRAISYDKPDHNCNVEDSEDDGDLVSIRSSIDLDEEPTVHMAQVMTFTRITPGMVKLVDIPPRRKNVAPAAVPTKATEAFPAFSSNKHGDVDPFVERRENMEPPGMSYTQHDSRLGNTKKSKLPRNESHLLVQDWITNFDLSTQRPISERFDPDVLADQQIPPAPFPKEVRPTPPPRQPSKHYCLNNGHIFHPIDLKQVPDQVRINNLEVRPYLWTPVGARQHVRVPVLCERCDEDVKEEIWECEIAVCRMVVCKECAEDMEIEWQERAVASWTK